jgi:hypothetical protein
MARADLGRHYRQSVLSQFLRFMTSRSQLQIIVARFCSIRFGQVSSYRLRESSLDRPSRIKATAESVSFDTKLFSPAHIGFQGLIPTVSPLMIPLVYCHINSFQRASSVARPWPGGEKRIDGGAAYPVGL